MKIETALLSVSDKTHIDQLGSQLVELGIEILSTGGTAAMLRREGVPVTEVSEYTGFPEILEGRVKTLHPRIYGGILARQEKAAHRRTLQEHEIPPIGLIVVNLYPFQEAVSRPGVTLEEALEQIDIGGPALLRAGAKNYASVTVLVDPADYNQVISELRVRGETREETRRGLALKAFQHTAVYDLAISAYLDGSDDTEELPARLPLDLRQQSTLRYGENPHQRGALYRVGEWIGGLAGARQHQGKKLSFNNYLDLDAAWNLAREFDEPFCSIIKHNNPCGAAVADSLVEAYRRALECDPVSAFGSVISFNRNVDLETAEELSQLFVEGVVAPGYQPEALARLGKKKNLRVMEVDLIQSAPERTSELDFKRIDGGFLVQDRDRFFVKREDLRVATERKPDEEEWRDMLFAWRVCKHVRSNAIVMAREGRTLGIGAGQMSRVDAVRLACEKARSPLEGAAMASDAFFPFRDGIDQAAVGGITSVIQPGGSKRDPEVIEAADELGMSMVLTGVRHFRH